MKSKIFSVLFALVLVLGLSLVTAVPVFALATGNIADNDLGAQVIGMAKTKCVHKVTITNPGGAGSLDIDSFIVSNTGTAGDADVNRVAIWEDTAAPFGTWDIADTEIGWAADFSGAGAIGVDDDAACLSVTSAAPKVIFVVVTTVALPADGNTFLTTIDGSDLVVATADTWDGTGGIATAASATTIDAVAPTVAITSTASPGLTYTSPIPMTATFSENVAGFVVGEITVGNGSAGNFNPVSGTVYTFDVTPATQGAVTVDIAAAVAQDAATNDNAVAPQFSITYIVPVVGGPPIPALQPGVTNVSEDVRPDGVFTDDVTASSDDGVGELIIEKGTKGLTKGGLRLSHIDFTTVPEGEEPSVGAGVQFAGNAYELGPSRATFEPAITIVFILDASEVPVDTTQVISYFDPDTGVWVNLDTTVSFDPAMNTYSFTAEVSHFTCFAVLAHEIEPPPPPAPAAFSVTDLSISPAEVQLGEAVTLTVSVANTGGSEGSYSIVLKINGAKEAEKSVTIAAGGSQSVTFSVTKEDSGSYDVAVDGLGGSLTVLAPPPPPLPAPAPVPMPTPPAKETGLPVGGVIAIIVVAVGLLIFFLIKLRR